MKRYALCIGNNDYEILTKIKYAVDDAKAVSEKLSTLGFDADLFLNLNASELDEKVLALSDKLEDYDAVFFYYAGHGFQMGGDNLLVPIDFDRPSDEKLAKRIAFPLDDLMHWLDKYPKKTKVIVLDACREEYSATRGTGFHFTSIIAPQGSIVAFSTSPGQTAKEAHGHGLYTKYLLEYMDEPRISIETMFKRVRNALAKETQGVQISWEHTSLIGDFQLNPKTLYDGVNYSPESEADRGYVFERNSQVKPIVEDLKTHNWAMQRRAIGMVSSLNFNMSSKDDLFVLGRNIYQAACGNCFDCQRFIDTLFYYGSIPQEAKSHLLNGMAFEIYYNHEGKLRRILKGEYASSVIAILESEQYLTSREFISSRLYNEDAKVFYIPGQNDKVYVCVHVMEDDGRVVVEDIIHQGDSIYYNRYNNQKPVIDDLSKEKTKLSFEAELRKKMVVMPGYLKITYDGCKVDGHSKLLLPFNGYNLVPREQV